MNEIFNTQYTRRRQPPERNEGEVLVDREGYVSTKTRIENLILAGQRLVEHRRQMYHYDGDDDIDDGYIDKTIAPSYDEIDAMEDIRRLRRKNEEIARKLEEAKVKASEVQPAGKEDPPQSAEE